MTDFLDATFDVDPSDLTDQAIAQLQATLAANGFPGWTPNEGNLEVILLTIIGQIAAEIAAMAGQVPAAIFRAIGTQLFNVSYEQGAAATCSSTWNLTDTLGHLIPGGTFVTVAGQGFYVASDVTVAAGASTATVLLVAVDNGVAFNGLSTPVAAVDEIDWVQSIAVIGTTANGADPEDDVAYMKRLAGQIALQAPRPITATDYPQMALSVPSTVIPAGVVVGRASAIDGYNPSVNSFTATTTNSSTTLSAVSSFTGISVGSVLAGAGIPAGATVVSINTGASTLVLSAAATSSNTAAAVAATGSYGNQRTITVFVTDPSGVALSGPAMTAIQNWLQTFREANFVVFVVAPSYTKIYVTHEIHVLPGYDPAGTVAAVNTAILAYLNPQAWGATASGSQWLNLVQGFNVVRYNKLLGIIEGVPGVDYVPSGSAGLAIGVAASPSGTADITLGGPAPLPQSDLSTPTVVGSAV